MKRFSIIATIAIPMFFAASASAAQREEPIAVNVTGLMPQVAERVKKHAEQGRTSLIRYVNATRMIHGFRVEQLVTVK